MEPYFLPYRRAVAARVSADVRHPYLNALAMETGVLRIPATDIRAIDVSEYSFQRFKRRKPVRQRQIAEVPRMPHLIASVKMPEDGIIQVAMRIRKQSDLLHEPRIYTF